MIVSIALVKVGHRQADSIPQKPDYFMQSGFWLCASLNPPGENGFGLLKTWFQTEGVFMVKKYAFVLFFPVFSLLALPVWGHGPHEHGVARLNVALEGQRLSIELDSPLANLLSFEHAPRTDPQQNEVRAMAARLRRAETLFVPSGAASCRLASVALESGSLPGNLLDSAAPSPARPDNARADDEKADAAEHGDL